MIAIVNETHRYESQFDDASEMDSFERFTYRQRGEFPVRSQAARTRAKMRGRGTAASRTKRARSTASIAAAAASNGPRCVSRPDRGPIHHLLDYLASWRHFMHTSRLLCAWLILFGLTTAARSSKLDDLCRRAGRLKRRLARRLGPVRHGHRDGQQLCEWQQRDAVYRHHAANDRESFARLLFDRLATEPRPRRDRHRNTLQRLRRPIPRGDRLQRNHEQLQFWSACPPDRYSRFSTWTSAKFTSRSMRQTPPIPRSQRLGSAVPAVGSI